MLVRHLPSPRLRVSSCCTLRPPIVQTVIRLFSSAIPPTINVDTPGQTPSVQSTPQFKSQPRRSLRPLIYATAFLFLGLTAGQLFRFTIVPPPLPIPSSREDLILVQALNKDADALPIVQELRVHLEDWIEHEAYDRQSHAETEMSLSANIMKGSRGLGVQRQFWNRKDRRMITVIFYGGALAGWPGVTHGGVLATTMEESMERVAASNNPDRIGITQNFNIKYIQPTHANRFYIIRAELNEPATDVATGSIRVKARLEDATTGAICAEATSLFNTNQE